MKETPSHLEFIKLEMAGQPVPDDPTWGTDGVMGEPSGEVPFNPQPVTTQAAADADTDEDRPAEKPED
ncbi:MAG: hypothetical protein GY888_33325 [Planctomycetaceae bacterium]|nr:hypothetical protein [Planctomycetaceae bacterium]